MARRIEWVAAHRHRRPKTQPQRAHQSSFRSSSQSPPGLHDVLQAHHLNDASQQQHRQATAQALTQMAVHPTACGVRQTIPEPVWESSVDEGWAAAEAAATPTVSGLTPAGLPRRVPLAHFVPGSADEGGRRARQVPASATEAVATRTSSWPTIQLLPWRRTSSRVSEHCPGTPTKRRAGRAPGSNSGSTAFSLAATPKPGSSPSKDERQGHPRSRRDNRQ